MPKPNTSRAGSAACLDRSGNATSDGDVVFRDTFIGDDGSGHNGVEIAHDVFRSSVRMMGKPWHMAFAAARSRPTNVPASGSGMEIVSR